MRDFIPDNHYWRVGGDVSRVWSSICSRYVPATDPTYVAWAAESDTTTPIASEADLAAALLAFGIYFDIRAYAASARYVKETGGVTVDNAPIATDRDSQALITGAALGAQMNPNFTAAWKTTSGFVTIGAAQINAIATAVLAHVQACFAVESQVDAGITAGTITTTAQIDAAFAAVTA